MHKMIGTDKVEITTEISVEIVMIMVEISAKAEMIIAHEDQFRRHERTTEIATRMVPPATVVTRMGVTDANAHLRHMIIVDSAIIARGISVLPAANHIKSLSFRYHLAIREMFLICNLSSLSN